MYTTLKNNIRSFNKALTQDADENLWITLYNIITDEMKFEEVDHITGPCKFYERTIFSKNNFRIHAYFTNPDEHIFFKDTKDTYSIGITKTDTDNYIMTTHHHINDTMTEVIDETRHLYLYEVFDNIFNFFRADFSDSEFAILLDPYRKERTL